MLSALRDGEDRALGEQDRALPCRFAKGDLQFSVEYEEELVGVVMDMPDVLAGQLGDAHVVVVDAREDAGAPEFVEAGQCLVEGDGLVAHGGILTGGPRSR